MLFRSSHLLEQIQRQQPELMKQNRLKINVVGISNSKRMLLNREGLDLTMCIKELKTEGTSSSPEALYDEIIRMNIFNSVFVDCISSEKITVLYEKLLDNNISVVAANKLAASSQQKIYQLLKDTARKRNVKYLFETNVGASLPIINTMNNLINSSDHILRLEAVVSGTLNFIFNTVSEDISLSRAIRMAVDAGYAEPNPRTDQIGRAHV